MSKTEDSLVFALVHDKITKVWSLFTQVSMNTSQKYVGLHHLQGCISLSAVTQTD